MLLPNSPNLKPAADDLDDIFEQIRIRVHNAMVATVTECGGLCVDELVQRLNTPYPPASEPDEDPHRRTGNLSAGVASEVEESSDGAMAIVSSSRAGGDENIPTYLEYGTSRGLAPRRYMQRTLEEWEGKFETVAAGIMAKELGL